MSIVNKMNVLDNTKDNLILEKKYNEVLKKKRNYLLNKVIYEIKKKNNLESKKMRLKEYDLLSEKNTDKINFKIYNHILNNSIPWNSFNNFLNEQRTNSKLFNKNYNLVINDYKNFENKEEEINSTMCDDIYLNNKEFIDKYLENHINLYINMKNGESKKNNVTRFVSNSYSIPSNCIDSGLLYAGTDFHSGYINIMTNLPYGHWYEIDKRLDERFENSQFEKDFLFYGNKNLPTFYFDSIYSQADRYYDDISWDILINEYEENEKNNKKIINENRKLLEELKNTDPYDETYGEVYMDPKLYPSYYSDYDDDFLDSDSDDSDF